jgi:hypothetical protein
VTPTLAGLQWTTPVLIADAATVSNLVVDAAGHLHVAGLAGRGVGPEDFENAVVYLSNSSGDWTAMQVTDWGGFATPALAVDHDGSAWLAFPSASVNDCTGCTPGPLFVTTNSSGEWIEPFVVGAGEFDRPSIVVSDGIAHLVYEFAGYECWTGDEDAGETLMPGPDCGVHYATNADGSWRTVQVDADTNYPEAALAVGSDGIVRLAYGRIGSRRQDAYGNGIQELVYGTLGASGSFDLSVITEAESLRGWGGEIQLLLDAADDPVMVLSNTDQVSEGVVTHWLVAPADDGWATQRLPLDRLYVSAVLTPDGQVHAIGYEPYDRPGLVYAAASDDEPVALTDVEVTGAAIATAGGTLHVVWSTASGVWHTTAPTD